MSSAAELGALLVLLLIACVTTRQARQAVQQTNACTYPCHCTDQYDCRPGVSIVMDGCGCCKMCARQQGDTCNDRDHCDRRLRCQDSICRAKAATPCQVNGLTYNDGQQFKLNCSTQCSCQNGRYICSDMCRHQAVEPPSTHCPHKQLVSIRRRCCKEWVCPHAHNIVLPPSSTAAGLVASSGQCHRETTEWSACSATCDVGVSIRVSNDNERCEAREEIRICLIRPCADEQGPVTVYEERTSAIRRRCKHSRRQIEPMHFVYNGCRSIPQFRPKFCGSCNTPHQKCCSPHKAKTRHVPFECADGETVWYQVMWIKSCKCEDKECV